MRTALLIFAAVACLTRPAQAELIGEIPYRIDYDGWYTVDVAVNGEGPFSFVIDSGATISSVFANLATKVEMTATDREPVIILGLSGSEMHDAVILGDLSLGPITLDDHIGVILDDWGEKRPTPAGVIGVDILSQYFILVDKRDQVIRLYTPDTQIKEIKGRWASTKMTPVGFDGATGRIFKIAVTMNNVDVDCIIDLGANGTVLNYAAVGALIDKGATTGGDRRRQQLRDIFDNVETAPPVRIARTKIARTRWRNKVYLVHDALFFKELGVNDTPFCLIGSDLMRSRSFIFDFKREQFYIRR